MDSLYGKYDRTLESGEPPRRVERRPFVLERKIWRVGREEGGAEGLAGGGCGDGQGNFDGGAAFTGFDFQRSAEL